MKAIVIAVVVSGLFFCTPVLSQSSYIGVFADVYRTCDAVKAPTPFYCFSMWIWCKPGANGQMFAEFSVDYPPNTIGTTVVWNDQMISLTLGDLQSGVSVCYKECQEEWNWPCYQYVYIMDLNPSTISIAAHPDVGAIQFANCLEGYPIEQAYPYLNLNVNQPGG